MQINRFLFEWENEGKVITMVVEVAIVTVLMATKKKKIAVHKQQGKGIDANLELESKTWMCCLSTHFTTFDH